MTPLHVFYDIDQGYEQPADTLQRMDALACELVGFRPTSRQTSWVGVRDLLFNFQNDADESTAKSKLQDEGFRFFP